MIYVLDYGTTPLVHNLLPGQHISMFLRFLYYDHPPERDITVIYRHLYLYTLFMFEVIALKLV